MSVSSEYADEDGMHKRRHKVLVSHKELQGSHKPGKPGIVREFCKPGKVREKSGNLRYGQGVFCDMSHGS